MLINPSTLSAEQRAFVERNYYEYLKRLFKSPKFFDQQRFDSQGRWIATVSLTDDDYLDIVQKLPGDYQNGDYAHNSKSWLREALQLNADDFTDTTLCSFDCQFDNYDKNKFLEWLYPEYLSQGAADQRLIQHRLDVFWKAKDRSSVIRLQEELESHQSLILRALEGYFTTICTNHDAPNVLGGYLRNTTLDLNNAIPDAIACVRNAMQRELNDKMRVVVRQALEASVEGDAF